MSSMQMVAFCLWFIGIFVELKHISNKLEDINETLKKLKGGE